MEKKFDRNNSNWIHEISIVWKLCKYWLRIIAEKWLTIILYILFSWFFILLLPFIIFLIWKCVNKTNESFVETQRKYAWTLEEWKYRNLADTPDIQLRIEQKVDEWRKQQIRINRRVNESKQKRIDSLLSFSRNYPYFLNAVECGQTRTGGVIFFIMTPNFDLYVLFNSQFVNCNVNNLAFRRGDVGEPSLFSHLVSIITSVFLIGGTVAPCIIANWIIGLIWISDDANREDELTIITTPAVRRWHLIVGKALAQTITLMIASIISVFLPCAIFWAWFYRIDNLHWLLVAMVVGSVVSTLFNFIFVYLRSFLLKKLPANKALELLLNSWPVLVVLFSFTRNLLVNSWLNGTYNELFHGYGAEDERLSNFAYFFFQLTFSKIWKFFPIFLWILITASVVLYYVEYQKKDLKK